MQWFFSGCIGFRWLAMALMPVIMVSTFGCSEALVNTSQSNDIAGASPPTADAWLGIWYGPEGTYLDIARNGENYDLSIANLDGPRTFIGQTITDGIRFVRDGQEATITRTNGDGTGMKWLAGKSNCLVIVKGEGFCRD
jgi:hypothetical protein